jgi:hypothetical protein
VEVGDSPAALVAADLDQDGDQDLAVANRASASISVLSNDGRAAFAVTSTLDVQGAAASLAAGDLNGDGYPDLCVGQGDGNRIAVLLNLRDGKFNAPVEFGTGGASADTVSMIDIDRDGDLDLIVLDELYGRVFILVNDGAASFQSVLTFAAQGLPTAVAVVDLNRDGRLDLVIADSAAGALHTYLDTGGRHFVAVASGQSLEQINFGSWTPWMNQDACFDVDSDGIIAPKDVLTIINDINARGARKLPKSPPNAVPFVDVNGDGILSPQDVLLVIKCIINQAVPGSPEGEAEAPPFPAMPGLLSPMQSGTSGGRVTGTSTGSPDDESYRRPEAASLDVPFAPAELATKTWPWRSSSRLARCEGTDDLEEAISTIAEDILWQWSSEP